MKKRRIVSIVVLIVTSFVLLIVNLRNTHAFYVDDDGNIITSSFNGEIMLYGGELTTNNKTYSNYHSNGMVLWILGGNFTMNHPTVIKSGDGGENDYLNGNNSAILIQEQGKYTMNSGNITTDATYAHGMIAYQGGNINVNDTSIVTKRDYSSGIMVSDGGNIIGKNLNIETFGNNSSAINSDKSGNINVDGGSYQTNGEKSPAIYSSLDINVKNANLVAKQSEGVIINGNHSVSLENSTLTSFSLYKNIFMYQSDSFDSSGTATFTSSNGKIVTHHGDTFSITNTNAYIKLINNIIVNSGDNFLKIGGSDYGVQGSNGGNVILDMIQQDAIGNITVDDISKLNMCLMNGSHYTGSINSSNSGLIHLSISRDSIFNLTGDTYVNSLEDEDSTYANIHLNGHQLFVNGEKLVIQNSSDVNEDTPSNTNQQSSSDNNQSNSSQQSSSGNQKSSNNNQQSSDGSQSSGNGVTSNNGDRTVNSNSSNSDTLKDGNSDDFVKKNESDNSSSVNNGNDDVMTKDKKVDDSSSDKDVTSYGGNVSNSGSIYQVDDKRVMIINIIGVVLIVTSIVSLVKTRKLKDDKND